MSGRSAVTGAAFFTQMGRDENSSSAAKPSWSKHWKQWVYYLGVPGSTWVYLYTWPSTSWEECAKNRKNGFKCDIGDVKNWRLWLIPGVARAGSRTRKSSRCLRLSSCLIGLQRVKPGN